MFTKNQRDRLCSVCFDLILLLKSVPMTIHRYLIKCVTIYMQYYTCTYQCMYLHMKILCLNKNQSHISTARKLIVNTLKNSQIWWKSMYQVSMQAANFFFLDCKYPHRYCIALGTPSKDLGILSRHQIIIKHMIYQQRNASPMTDCSHKIL